MGKKAKQTSKEGLSAQILPHKLKGRDEKPWNYLYLYWLYLYYQFG
jgi:hypothetical protein